MSRYTFTTDTEQWSVGYDTTLETHYAQVEPRRDRTATDAALDPELDDRSRGRVACSHARGSPRT